MEQTPLQLSQLQRLHLHLPPPPVQGETVLPRLQLRLLQLQVIVPRDRYEQANGQSSILSLEVWQL